MNRKQVLILIGSLLIGIGIFMFFKSTYLVSFGFYRLGRVSTGGILITLILADVILLVATRHKACKITLPILAAMLILSVILGTSLVFTGSTLDLFLMLVPAAVGAGLLLRAFLIKKE